MDFLRGALEIRSPKSITEKLEEIESPKDRAFDQKEEKRRIEA